MVTSARIWPGPGVAISSARHESGTCPRTSGAPRTRLFQRWNVKPSAKSGCGSEATDQATGFPKSMPPGRSQLPVRTFTTSTSHDASVPNSCVQVPMRP